MSSKSVSLVAKEDEEDEENKKTFRASPKDREEKADDRVNRDADNRRNMANDTEFIL